MSDVFEQRDGAEQVMIVVTHRRGPQPKRFLRTSHRQR